MDKDKISQLSSNLIDVFTDINRKVFNPTEFMKSFTLPPSHVKVLFHLVHCGPKSISEVAKMLMISKPNMTPIIDNLLKDGYIKRYESSKDRRVLIIEATPLASELFLKKKQEFKDTLAIKLADIKDEDFLTLDQSIKNIGEIMSKLK